MKTKTTQKLTKIIIVFIINLILLSQVMPSLVFADHLRLKEIEEYLKEKGITDEQEQKQFDDFMDIINYSNKPVETNEEEYKSWLDPQIEYFKQYYKPYLEQNNDDAAGDYNKEGKYYEPNRKNGDLSISSQYHDVDYKNYIEARRESYGKYAKENGAPEEALGQSNQERKEDEQQQAEEEEDYFEKDEESSGIFGPVFETIMKLAIAIADSAENIMQNLMLPGSPTAIANRVRAANNQNDPLLQYLKERDNSKIMDFLNERENDSYKIFFERVKNYNGTKKVEYDTSTVNTGPIPFIYYTPAAIFSNKIPALDIDFISGDNIKNPFIVDENGNSVVDKTKELLEVTEKQEKKVSNGGGFIKKEDNSKVEEKKKEIEDMASDVNAKENNKSNPAIALQGTIQKWYVALRNITIVGLLIVLIYIGIRILISAAADEKAKYKEMLKDWFMALILVVTLHYIMIILINIVKILSKLITTNLEFANSATGGDPILNEIRTKIVFNARKDNWVTMGGYGILYITLIWYTVIFTWRYIKRVIYMAFLTIIAPVVALTYPLDRMRDGRSQAFNLWRKEYTFNLLLQPINLILYTVMVTSAMKLVQVNVIYAIIAIGFILESEKIIKKMFGLHPQLDNGIGDFSSGAIFGALMSGVQTGSKDITEAMKETEEEKPQQNKIRMQEETDGRTPDKNKAKHLSGFAIGNQKQTTPIQEGTPTPQSRTSSTTTPNIGQSIGSNSRRTTTVPPLTAGTIQPQITEIEENQEQPPKRKIKGIGNGRISRAAGRLRGRYINTNTAKKAGKLAVMGLGAGTFGLMGVGAGLASDKYSNVYKMGAAGLAGGAIIGNQTIKIANATKNQIDESKEAYQRGYYGDEYNEKVKNPKLDRKWYYSEETKTWLIQKYGKNWKEKREEALELRKQGITSRKDIEKAINLKNKNPELTTEQAGNAIRFANNITSREEILENGGEEKVHRQVLNLVGGDEEQAEKAMNAIKQTLNLGGIRTQEVNQNPETTHTSEIPEEPETELPEEPEPESKTTDPLDQDPLETENPDTSDQNPEN